MKFSYSFKIIILVIAAFVISYLTSEIPIPGSDIFYVSSYPAGYEIPKGLPFAFTYEPKVRGIPPIEECLGVLCLGIRLGAFLLDVIFWGFLIYFSTWLIKKIKS